MDISKEEASVLLDKIDNIGRQVRRSFYYRRSSVAIIIWGVLTFFGYLLTYYYPHMAIWTWNIVYICGIAGSFLTGALKSDRLGQSGIQWNLIFAYLLFFAFGFTWTKVIGSFTPRQLGAFWPTYFMLAYILVGLWVGRGIVWIGLAIAAMTVAIYLYSGPYFDLMMAFANGVCLILAGAWMRRG